MTARASQWQRRQFAKSFNDMMPLCGGRVLILSGILAASDHPQPAAIADHVGSIVTRLHRESTIKG